LQHADQPISLGLTGLGGYAAYVCDRILAQQQQQDGSQAPAARLVAVAEPHLERFPPQRLAELRARGVRVLKSFDELLNEPVDALWLPLPIDLHLPYTQQALAAGKSVLCEKPAAGCVDDVDRMIAARDACGGRLTVAVGFQDIYQPAVARLKRRLLAGEFGRPLDARVIGCWPRSERYYTRNDWAGRCRRDGRWVMDSPASNALAHYLHLALFLLGDGFDRAARPTSVAAELYRANHIENYDTCSLRYAVDGIGGAEDVPLTVGFTHAAATAVEPVVMLRCEQATIRYISGRHIEITREDGAAATGDGRMADADAAADAHHDAHANGGDGHPDSAAAERLPLSSNPHNHMLAAFARAVRAGAAAEDCTGAAGFCATLESARQHVVAVNAASESAPVHDVSAAEIRIGAAASDNGWPLRSIAGIVPALRAAFAEGTTLYETGLAAWSRPPSRPLGINGYHHFKGPAAAATAAATATAPATAFADHKPRVTTYTDAAPPSKLATP
jgi:predicted dehydrogenase